MADFTVSKDGIGDVYPVGGGATTWQRIEPLITPQDVIDLYLFGIPLYSGFKDPVTLRPAHLTPTQISKFIDKAVAKIELETGLIIFPTQFTQKLPFDKCEYESFGFFRLEHRPIASLQSIDVTLANQQSVFSVPIEWADVGNLHRGQVNLIPLTLALTGQNQAAAASAGGAVYLAILGNRNWIASFWQMVYTAGFPNGKIPKVVNQIIGLTAALDILSMLGITFRANSASLSLDGMSQSVSGPGPAIFAQRIKEIMIERQTLIAKLKAQYGLKILSSNV